MQLKINKLIQHDVSEFAQIGHLIYQFGRGLPEAPMLVAEDVEGIVDILLSVNLLTKADVEEAYQDGKAQGYDEGYSAGYDDGIEENE